MKFQITRTTGGLGVQSTRKPIERAVEIAPDHFEIEISTMEELLALGTECGEELIVTGPWIDQRNKPDRPTIEIYDTYRE